MSNESDNYVPISTGDIFLDPTNYEIYKGPIINVDSELITVKPFNVPKEEQGKKDYFLIQYPRFAVTEDMIKRESKPGEIKGGANYKCGDIVRTRNEDTSEYFIIEKKEVDIEGVKHNCYVLGCVNYEYERIEVKTKVIESEFTKVEDDTFFEKQLAHCFINKFGEDSITNIDSSNKSKGKNNKLDKKIGIINDLLRLFENVLNQDYEELRFFTEDDVDDYEVEYNGTFASLIEHTDWWFLTELEETNRYILDVRKLYRWNFFDKTPRDRNRFNIIFEILDKYYKDGDNWLSKNYISINYKDLLQNLYDLLKIRNETQTIKRSTGKSKKKTSGPKEDNISNVVDNENSEEIFIGGVDLIIYHILNLNNNPCLLLNNISYKNKNVEIGDGLGYLFNMKFNVNGEQINEVTLNYNMLGFLMLLTELEHDFAEVKKINNAHLDTINQNFINISHALKEQIKKIVDINTDNPFFAAATKASEPNCDNLWDNIYGVIDSYSGNKKKKLSEEEMGRIITALLSNDDMPRLITANDKVNMQMYAPTPLKGTIPKFWSIMNTDTSDISDDIEESSDEDLKDGFNDFVFILNMQREQLENIQKEDEKVTAIIDLIYGLIEYIEKLKNIEDYKSGVLYIRGSLNKLKESYFEKMEQQTGVAYESYRAIDSGVKGLETKLPNLENPGSDFKAMSTTKESIITPISYAEKTINLTSDADNKAAYVIPKTTNMRQIKSDNYPLLKLDAGSSPTFKRNDEYYSWFDSLNKDEDEVEDEDVYNIPVIKVLNPLDGKDLITLTPNGNKWQLKITVYDESDQKDIVVVEEAIKDLSKTTMSDFMINQLESESNKVYVNVDNGKIERGYSMKLFAVSILKSLGDLVCYITANMQAFLNQYNYNGTVPEEMFLCNSADYSMFYPMVGYLEFTGEDKTKINKINKAFDNTSVYLSCSVKSVQNFFVPLTRHEKDKLFLIKEIDDKINSDFDVLKNVFLFAEKYSSGADNKFLSYLINPDNNEENINLFEPAVYNKLKDVFLTSTQPLKLILEYYFSFMYLSFCFQNEQDKANEIKELLNPNDADNILNKILDINKRIFEELYIPGVSDIEFNLRKLGLIEDNNTYSDSNQKSDDNDYRLVKMEEVQSSFFSSSSESLSEINFTMETWKVYCIYAEYILRFKNIKIDDSGVEGVGVEGVSVGVEEGIVPGGKRRNKSKKNGKKSNKRQTRKANK
jgi:hypothetical protein